MRIEVVSPDSWNSVLTREKTPAKAPLGSILANSDAGSGIMMLGGRSPSSEGSWRAKRHDSSTTMSRRCGEKVGQVLMRCSRDSVVGFWLQEGRMQCGLGKAMSLRWCNLERTGSVLVSSLSWNSAFWSP
jgi:hypothetical protein